MKVENFNIRHKKPRVLIAPLDWGLGHATRCIPIILSLTGQGCEVILAADGAAKQLLLQEFPDLVFTDIRGYRVMYSRKRFWLLLKLVLQLPKILFRIYAENRWLQKTVRQFKIDAVISDNRPGMYHVGIPSVYITHQLQIKTGRDFTERLAQKTHYHYIKKYTECWVPDVAGEINLAGELSHPSVLPDVPVKYIGPLSRFKKLAEEIKYDLCFVISGPEPQRSLFEEIIFRELKDYGSRSIVVRGLPGETSVPKINNPSVEIINHLPATELNKILQQSKLIISRSGYSTIMDLVALQKQAVLVPTPGQTEQEYLAEYLQKRGMFFCATQSSFSLPEILKNTADFSFNETAILKNDYNAAIRDFVARLKKVNSTGI